VKQRLNALLDRLRAAGVIGLGVLLACAAFQFSALAPAEQQLADQRAARARLRALPGERAAATASTTDLRQFYGHFPTIDAAGDELERIHQLARSSGLELAQGEYRLEQRSSGLWAYRANLPLRGSYSQIRTFAAALLKEMPPVSVDALRFERKKASETQLEARLRLTVYLRPSGEPS